MADVKDILGVPREGEGSGRDAGKKAGRAPKAAAAKPPKGISREAFALLDGSHPIMPQVLSSLAKKGKGGEPRGKVKWEWKAFQNAARKDGLTLKHWERTQGRGGFPGSMGADGEYVFAKYNKRVQVYRYDDEEWQMVKDLGGASWTREETDYLLDMCERFDLRFVVIADRYDFGGAVRSVDDLKDRYYGIARKLAINREGGEKAAAHVPLVKYPFNFAHERDRKHALEVVMSRSATQEREEQAVLKEAAEIEAARRLETAAEPTLKLEELEGEGHECTYGLHENRANPSLCSSAGILQKPPFPDCYARRKYTKKATAEVLASLSGGPKMHKLFEAVLSELGVASLPLATKAACAAWVKLHVEVAEFLEMKKADVAAGNKAAITGLLNTGAQRETQGAPVATEAQAATPPPAVGDAPANVGAGAGLTGGRQKREVKRKVPARFDDMAMTLPRTESKRARLGK